MFKHHAKYSGKLFWLTMHALKLVFFFVVVYNT